MITFKQYASSSSGNLYEVRSGNNRLMIEAGMSWKVIQAMMSYDIDRITGWLLTHEHKDHSAAIKEVLAAGIQVYASEGTLEACGIAGRRNTEVLTSGVVTHFNGWSVYAFDSWHDSAEPQGFIISDGKESMLFVTDSYNITQKFENKFDIIAIECSYDKDILTHNIDNELVNEVYARRLLTSHLEKEACKLYLNSCDLSKCREIHLLHMSKQNLNPASTVIEFENEFNRKVVVI